MSKYTGASGKEPMRETNPGKSEAKSGTKAKIKMGPAYGGGGKNPMAGGHGINRSPKS